MLKALSNSGNSSPDTLLTNLTLFSLDEAVTLGIKQEGTSS